MNRITIANTCCDTGTEWHPQLKRRVSVKRYKVLAVEGSVFYTAGGVGVRYFHPGNWISDVEIEFLQPKGTKVIRTKDPAFAT